MRLWNGILVLSHIEESPTDVLADRLRKTQSVNQNFRIRLEMVENTETVEFGDSGNCHGGPDLYVLILVFQKQNDLWKGRCNHGE